VAAESFVAGVLLDQGEGVGAGEHDGLEVFKVSKVSKAQGSLVLLSDLRDLRDA
jgi:hypothetical protein